MRREFARTVRAARATTARASATASCTVALPVTTPTSSRNLRPCRVRPAPRPHRTRSSTRNARAAAERRRRRKAPRGRGSRGGGGGGGTGKRHRRRLPPALYHCPGPASSRAVRRRRTCTMWRAHHEKLSVGHGVLLEACRPRAAKKGSAAQLASAHTARPGRYEGRVGWVEPPHSALRVHQRRPPKHELSSARLTSTPRARSLRLLRLRRT